ncbi:MAG: sel1 repeat family protein, partial [Clostridia bacterium]|nr:sel1 repeat family protein [Clostridia bacterium]
MEKEKLSQIIDLAEKGDADAQYALGNCYMHGDGVEENWSIAFDWYLRSAKQGNAEAQSAVADCYDFGFGVNSDLTAAYQWYLKA